MHSASGIAHAGMTLLNPLASEQIDAAIARLRLAEHDRVLDVGCGKGEVLARIVARNPGITGLGIDTDPGHIAEARARRIREIEWRLQEAAELREYNFAAVVCIGSSHAIGGFPDALVRLRGLARPGGSVIIGEGFWRRPPSREYLAALGATADELADRAGLLEAITAAGLRTDYITEAADDSWRAYEERLADNADRWGLANPEDALAGHARAYADALRTRWEVPGGTDTLGFALAHCVRIRSERG